MFLTHFSFFVYDLYSTDETIVKGETNLLLQINRLRHDFFQIVLRSIKLNHLTVHAL